MSRANAKLVLPILVLIAGTGVSLGLVAASPRAARVAIEAPLPLVPTAALEPQDARVIVESQGTVTPHTEVELVAEVAGRILSVSPALASGGFLETGDVLAEIDPTDYELAVERAEAALERATSELGLASATRDRRETLARDGVASAAALDDARSRERVARALVRDAEASLEQARRDLSRTRIVAPFAGRVRSKYVDRGQYVGRGTSVARIYAVDYAEVRLPIADREGAFLDLPIDYRDYRLAPREAAGARADDPQQDEGASPRGPEVVLRAQFAGREHAWNARIVRTEGEIDARTRMLHAVARVEDPYGRKAEAPGPPLAVGLFVRAEIEGRPLEDVYVLPRSAVRGDRALVIDAEDRVRLRPVELVRTQRDQAFVRGDLRPGDRLPLAALQIALDGAQVRSAPEPTP